MKIGILCPAEIASRRFMPALAQVTFFEFSEIGVATIDERKSMGPHKEEAAAQSAIERQREKAESITSIYGGTVVSGYDNLLKSPNVDAVYIPLPPAFHFEWAKRALMSGKHVMLEKPFTISKDTTDELLKTARENRLAVHENYMFAFHSQIDYVKKVIASENLGKIRTLRIDFGFPFREANDFRYSKEMGGGALFDCGGYTLKLANLLLGPSTRIVSANMNFEPNVSVDLSGCATLQNDAGLTAQVAFGMDNDYRCNIDIWGSEGSLSSNRILTAPADYKPVMILKKNGNEEVFGLDADDSFKKSIEYFADAIANERTQTEARAAIERQAQLVDSFQKCSGNNKME